MSGCRGESTHGPFRLNIDFRTWNNTLYGFGYYLFSDKTLHWVNYLSSNLNQELSLISKTLFLLFLELGHAFCVVVAVEREVIYEKRQISIERAVIFIGDWIRQFGARSR